MCFTQTNNNYKKIMKTYFAFEIEMLDFLLAFLKHRNDNKHLFFKSIFLTVHLHGGECVQFTKVTDHMIYSCTKVINAPK